VQVTPRQLILLPLALASVLGSGSGVALAQDGGDAAAAEPAPAAASGVTAAAADYVHFVMIARPAEALAAVNGLLDASISPTDLASAIDDAGMGDRIEAALRRSRGMADVSDAAAALEAKLESGRRELARNSGRIDQAVTMLVGPMRGQELARARLRASGEYAVPALLRRIVDGRDPGMEAAATRMLVELRRQSALPLSLALGSVDPASQRKVCAILGQLGYPVAVPFLLDLAQAKGSTSDIVSAAKAAVRSLGGEDMPAHASYAAVARSFLARDQSLAAYPLDPTQNFWKWTEFGGLAGEPITTSAYFDSMAMFMSRRALELDPADSGALAVFLAADLRREAGASESTVDPLFGSQGRSAKSFATASGAAVMQDVLRIGLDLRDISIVRASLDALRETAGVRGMVGNGDSPAILALEFGDRRVRTEAALALASVDPLSSFPGSEQVVPILASAIRGGGSTFAGIISGGSEEAQRASAMLQSTSMTPLPPADDAGEFAVVSARSAGADVVVITGRGSWVRKEFESLRASAAGATIPAVLVSPPDEKGMLDRLAVDGQVVVLASDVTDDAFRAGTTALLSAAMGGREGAIDGSRYFGLAVEALERIGTAGGPVYRLADGEGALIAAMRSQEGPSRLAVAALVSMVNSDRAQRALIDAALAAGGDEQVGLLQSVAQGARRFGPKATSSQSDAIRELVRNSAGATSEAASAAFGALGMPSSEAVKLILDARVPGKKAEPAPVAEPAPSDAPAEGAAGDETASGEPGMGGDAAGG
jgi:hypothetical protein